MTARNQIVWETSLPLPLVSRGKVRDIYAAGDDKLLMVTTDRLSAFDVVLPTAIPYKGCVLNQISLFWFEKFKKLVPNHVMASDVEKMGFDKNFAGEYRRALAGRSILVRRAKPLPVECVVRGFLAGSGWKDYLKTGAVCGQRLPPGLRQCEELPRPLFTPATKAASGHDQNIDFAEVVKLVGRSLARRIRDLSLKIYQEGVRYAKRKGILIADTKFEFGLFRDRLILIDEVLTPDSSRFWPKDKYKAGQDQPSFDKQIVRNFLTESGWNQEPPGPELPEKIVRRTSQAYRDVFRRLTGKELACV
ncbi:MAG: phosphoribosylaminoimidazolesuccinocarboxamide synthase [Candidatus Omnitrophica bacterium]|nr:phosphoribosylaminoimidazolesuccinocarboxamide synthase [Candidatus Omnitrophota bacterium]